MNRRAIHHIAKQLFLQHGTSGVEHFDYWRVSYPDWSDDDFEAFKDYYKMTGHRVNKELFRS